MYQYSSQWKKHEKNISRSIHAEMCKNSSNEDIVRVNKSPLEVVHGVTTTSVLELQGLYKFTYLLIVSSRLITFLEP